MWVCVTNMCFVKDQCSTGLCSVHSVVHVAELIMPGNYTAYLEVNELRIRVDRHCFSDASQGDNGWGQCHLLVCQGPELSTEACSPKPRQHPSLPIVLQLDTWTSQHTS